MKSQNLEPIVDKAGLGKKVKVKIYGQNLFV